MDRVKNNREYHRDWFKCLIQEQKEYYENQRKERNSPTNNYVNAREYNPLRQGHGFGFEYGVQDDGITLLNHHWKRKINYASIFQITNWKRFNRDLCDIKIDLFENQHESILETNTYVKQTKNVKQKKEVLSPSSSKFVQSAPSSTRRKRNRHNAIYGDFLPNILNSPGCAKKVFGKKAIEKEQREICARVLFEENDEAIQTPSVNRVDDNIDNIENDGNNCNIVNDLDEMDLLFATLDLDQIVSKYYQEKKSVNEKCKEPMQETSRKLESKTSISLSQTYDEIDVEDRINLTQKLEQNLGNDFPNVGNQFFSSSSKNSLDSSISSPCSTSTEMNTSHDSFYSCHS